MKAFPPIRDLVTDVSWNYAVKKTIKPFKPRKPDAPDGTWRMAQATSTACRNSASASSASCARTSATCCASTRCTTEFIGPRFLVYAAALEMHPLDAEDRLADLKDQHGIGYCNITQVLHQGVPGDDHDHRQCDHPAEGTRRGPLLRSGHAGCSASSAADWPAHAGKSRRRPCSSSRPCRQPPFRRRSPRRTATACSTNPPRRRASALDVLRIDPDNQDALVTLVLSYTDQFPDGPAARAMAAAEQAVARIADEYKREYFSGIIRERRGKAELRSDRPGSGRSVHEWLRDAMACYERAEALRPEDNDEALLRWNTCARILMTLPAAAPDVPEYNAIQSE